MAATGIHRCSVLLLAAAVVLLGLLAATASAREAPGGNLYEPEKQQHVSVEHNVPSGPNPGSNESPLLPPQQANMASLAEKQQHVTTQHGVPSGPNPGSNESPLLPPPRGDAAATLPWRKRVLLPMMTPVADGEKKHLIASA